MANKLMLIVTGSVADNPELIRYWDFERNTVSPNLFKPTSIANVYWCCPNDSEHYWIAAIKDMAENCICPGCNPPKQLVSPPTMQSTKRSFAEAHPDIAAEWYQPLNGNVRPDKVTECSGIYVWWKCREGHVWRDSIAHRVYGRNCPYCSGKRALAGFNDFATKFPEMIREWDTRKNGDLLPYELTWCSGKKVGWHCDKNHRWDTTVAHRAYSTGCPYCAGQKVWPGFNDLRTMYPEVAAQWHPTENGTLTPEDMLGTSNKYAMFLCEKGHKYRAQISNRTVNGTGCPYCNNRKVLLGFNDLYTTHREIALEWDIEANGKVTPFSVVAGCNKEYGWKCYRGHTWIASPLSRVYGGHGCPYCSGRLPIVGETDLATVSPELASQWDKKRNGKLTPQMVTRHSTTPVWWVCQYDKRHFWCAPPNARHDPNRGCPYCSCGNKVSFPEKALSYYMPNGKVENANLDIPGFGRKTVDVWIPSLNTALEYDGGPWHKNTKRDLEKDKLCSDAGIRMIRIRDCDCPTYETDAELVFRSDHSDKSLEDAIRTVLEMIGYEKDVNIERDRFRIQQLVYIPTGFEGDFRVSQMRLFDFDAV